MDERQKAAREYLRRVRKVLHTDWNPISCEVPEDEYDDYAGPVATLLLRNAPDAEIAAYLERVEMEMMGMDGPFPPDRFNNVLAALKALSRP